MVLQTIGHENGSIMLIEVSHGGQVVARYGDVPAAAKALVSHADVMLHNTAMKEQKLGDVRLLISESENEAIIANRIKSLVINMMFGSSCSAWSCVTCCASWWCGASNS